MTIEDDDAEAARRTRTSRRSATAALREWVGGQAEPLLKQGWATPDILDQLVGDLPHRFAEAASRPGLNSILSDIAKAKGYRVNAIGVSEPGQYKQLELLTEAEVIRIGVKRKRQSGNIWDAYMVQTLLPWCELHPDVTVAVVLAKIQEAAAG